MVILRETIHPNLELYLFCKKKHFVELQIVLTNLISNKAIRRVYLFYLDDNHPVIKRTYTTMDSSAAANGYHCPNAETVQELNDLANRMRITAIQITNAANSGCV